MEGPLIELRRQLLSRANGRDEYVSRSATTTSVPNHSLANSYQYGFTDTTAGRNPQAQRSFS